MALTLPDPDASRLPNSPLELALCQIRFSKRLSVTEPGAALAFHKELGGEQGEYPRLEEVEAEEVRVSGGRGQKPSAESQTTRGWRIVSEQGDWIVNLMPDYVSLETTAYTTWDGDFRPRLEEMVRATVANVGPDVEQRLGLRYIDKIRELGLRSIREWSDYIVPELLGPIMHEDLGPAIAEANQKLLIEVDREIRAGVRHGPVKDAAQGTVDYQLDYDVFRNGVREFDAEGVLDAADRFNRTALQLFYASMTEKLISFMRGE